MSYIQQHLENYKVYLWEFLFKINLNRCMSKRRNYYVMRKLKVDFILIYLNIFSLPTDLRMLFELINRINKADEPIQKDLETYAYQIGMDEISAKKETAIKVNFILLIESKLYLFSIRILKFMLKQSLKFMRNFQKLLLDLFVIAKVIQLHLIK